MTVRNSKFIELLKHPPEKPTAIGMNLKIFEGDEMPTEAEIQKLRNEPDGSLLSRYLQHHLLNR